jgi:hypothetical protein
VRNAKFPVAELGLDLSVDLSDERISVRVLREQRDARRLHVVDHLVAERHRPDHVAMLLQRPSDIVQVRVD